MWRFNCSFLHENTFLEKVNKAIDEVLIREAQQTPDLKWEAVKNAIVLEATKFGINRKRAQNRLTQLLVHKLDKLNQKLDKEVEKNKIGLIQRDIKKRKNFCKRKRRKPHLRINLKTVVNGTN